MKFLYHSFSSLFLTVCLISALQAQTSLTRSFVHGGITRNYRIYIPAVYTGSQPVPLVLNLHGYGSNAFEQEIYGDFRPIADTANFILVSPDGTVQPGTTDTQYWNVAGLFSSSVDDVDFLETLIDTIDAHYNINRSRVYSAGMSNGGFMGYLLACESQQFAAIGSVTGSMTTVLYNSCNPAHPVPVIEIHGTADGTVPYNGVTGVKAIPDVVNFWVTQNNCSPTPTTSNVPDINTTDSATAEHYLYTGGTNGHTVEHFKVIGGAHTWPGAVIPIGVTCMDFSASKELWRFFSQYNNPTAGIAENTNLTWNLWPNPATEQVFLQVPDQQITDVRIYDMQGRTVYRFSAANISSVDVSQLPTGQYLLEASGKGFLLHKKLLVQ